MTHEVSDAACGGIPMTTEFIKVEGRRDAKRYFLKLLHNKKERHYGRWWNEVLIEQ
jgi:hypothetical protein